MQTSFHHRMLTAWNAERVAVPYPLHKWGQSWLMHECQYKAWKSAQTKSVSQNVWSLSSAVLTVGFLICFPASDGLQIPGAASSGPWQQDCHVGSFVWHQCHLTDGCLLWSCEGKTAIAESHVHHLDLAQCSSAFLFQGQMKLTVQNGSSGTSTDLKSDLTNMTCTSLIHSWC